MKAHYGFSLMAKRQFNLIAKSRSNLFLKMGKKLQTNQTSQKLYDNFPLIFQPNTIINKIVRSQVKWKKEVKSLRTLSNTSKKGLIILFLILPN